MITEDVGRAVKIVRALRGMSQAQVARACGLTPSYLSYIESNKREPSLAVLRKLCQALDVRQSDMMRLAEDAQGALGVSSFDVYERAAG